MLKNKKVLYLLIPLNVFIWGYLGYSIYSGLKGEDAPEANNLETKVVLADNKDTVAYKLALNYADPFLKEVEKPKRGNYNSNQQQSPSENTQKAPIAVKVNSITPPKPAAELNYLGIVKNSSTGQSTALFTINGKSFVIKKGDVVEGFTIKDISTEFVEVKEGKQIFKVGKGG